MCTNLVFCFFRRRIILLTCVLMLLFFFRRRMRLLTCVLILVLVFQKENEIVDMSTNISVFVTRRKRLLTSYYFLLGGETDC